MEVDKLLNFIKVQTEIINILCREYKSTYRSPFEKEKMTE